MPKSHKKQEDTANGARDEAAKENKLQLRIDELTADLQRNRADFENYVRRTDAEKLAAKENGEASAILKLLPVIDNVERAITHLPEDISEHPWAQGVVGLVKNLDKSLAGLGLERIDAKPGTIFDPEIHDAIQVDEDAEGEREVIAEELQPGYKLRGRPIRHAMVKVTREK
jgi:molecular chaperone GrpE